ncbi:MAG: glycogen synthase GlgA [Candidatus Omnitrophica bacterium]|nr:glycogen synthase GlgA [Candidatus Omnitrophota bacterium]
MHITFCAVEAVPFAQTGGLGDVCGSLPLALAQRDVSITILLPRYKFIDAKKFGITPVDKSLSRRVVSPKLDVYFIEHDYYGKRDGIYGDDGDDYPDNLERFQYFCSRALKTLEQLKKKTDIIHCHDWHTALIPIYLKEYYKNSSLAKAKTILTVHNMAHQGMFPQDRYPKLNLPATYNSPQYLEYFGQINFLKGGIVCSDKVTTVSKQYAKEILTKDFGCGLEGVLKARRDPVVGIVNGINHEVWNPVTDPKIERTYTKEEVTIGKTANKTKLQQLVKLPQRDDVPLFAFVSRLVHQKGMDLIFEVMEQFLDMDVQAVMLGTGDRRYEKQVKAYTDKYPGKIWANFEFDDPLAHQVYAGADWFLMPSRFEPCGLSQMISMAYGTIPIAFKTGGLVDTVEPFNAKLLKGNGILFNHFTKKDFLQALRQAMEIYPDEKKFHALRQNALATDFSWEHAAEEYIKVYQCLLSA